MSGGAANGEEAKRSGQPDEPRMVYVGNLAWSVKWQDLKDHMKEAGEVEFVKVLTQDGYDWGRSRGVGYVRYSSEDEAKTAVEKLNGTEVMGRKITVDAWTGSKPRSGPPKGAMMGMDAMKGGFGFMPPFMGGKGGKGLFGFKGGKGGLGPMDFFKGAWGMGFGGKGFGKSMKVHGELDQMVYVGNLPFKMQWQELKDHMKDAGTVEFVKILTEEAFDYSRSKGMACVRFSSADEAKKAIADLNGTAVLGRTITVDKWTTRGGKGTDAEKTA